MFLKYLTSDNSQRYFSDGKNEWPVVPDIVVKNPVLKAMGKFKADTIAVATLVNNSVTAQKVFDRSC